MGDKYGIIPYGVQAARVKPFEFQVRTMVDYDMNFMSDRVVSEIFVNGVNTGVYATARVYESYSDYGTRQYELNKMLTDYAPELERIVVDEFMGLGYRERVRALEDRVRHLTRIRWWHFRSRWNSRKEEK